MTRLAFAALLCLIAISAGLSQDKPSEPIYSVPEGANFTPEDVSIDRKSDDGDFKIAGTLNIPKGEKPESGWPAVLFISGSGAETRHGFQGVLDTGSWELTDAISNAGFAVLAVDDRGIGKTPAGPAGFDVSTLGYDELVGDAQAALTYLIGRAEIDKSRVFIIGHSEGGLTAPILAGRNDIAGVVFMAGMGRNLYDVTIDQTTAAMEKLPKAMRENNMKVQREFQDAVKEDREPNFEIIGKDKATVDAIKAVYKKQVEPLKAWWHDHFVLDVPAIHAEVKCPCFVANGQADFQVSPEKDAKQIVTNLMAGKCGDVTLKLYDDLDHLFKPCNGRKSELKLYYEDRRLDAGYLKDVVAWLEAHR
ncbi:MAG: alpha/beta fold hydrolase [Planctomycetes bacterium]|nr:alpha/beta fold hydrolase [Planctomycetota bacterium]